MLLVQPCLVPPAGPVLHREKASSMQSCLGASFVIGQIREGILTSRARKTSGLVFRGLRKATPDVTRDSTSALTAS